MAKKKTYEIDIVTKGLKEVVSELKKLNKRLDKTEENAEAASRGMDSMTKAAKKAKKASGEFISTTTQGNRALKGTGQATNNTTRSFSKMASGIQGTLVPAYATIIANVFALSQAFTILKGAANFDLLIKGSEILSKTTGANIKGMSLAIRELTNNAISMKEALQKTTQVAAAGFGKKTLVELTKVAKGASIALGRDLGDSLDRVFKGALKAEPELLDELGIILRLEPATQKYAAAIGKTVQSLSTFEKQQAVANEVIEQGLSKFGELAESDVNPYDKLLASLKDLGTNVARVFNTIIMPAINFMSDNLVTLAGLVGLFAASLLKQAIPSLGKMTDIFGKGLEKNQKKLRKLSTSITEAATSGSKAFRTLAAAQLRTVDTDGARKLADEIEAGTVNAVEAEKRMAKMQVTLDRWAKSLESSKKKAAALRKEIGGIKGNLKSAESGTRLYANTLKGRLARGYDIAKLKSLEFRIGLVKTGVAMSTTTGIIAKSFDESSGALSFMGSFGERATAISEKIEGLGFSSKLAGSAVKSLGFAMNVVATAAGGLLKALPWIIGVTVAFQILSSIGRPVLEFFGILSKDSEGLASKTEEVAEATRIASEAINHYNQNLADNSNRVDAIIQKNKHFGNVMSSFRDEVLGVSAELSGYRTALLDSAPEEATKKISEYIDEVLKLEGISKKTETRLQKISKALVTNSEVPLFVMRDLLKEAGQLATAEQAIAKKREEIAVIAKGHRTSSAKSFATLSKTLRSLSPEIGVLSDTLFDLSNNVSITDRAASDLAYTIGTTLAKAIKTLEGKQTKNKDVVKGLKVALAALTKEYERLVKVSEETFDLEFIPNGQIAQINTFKGSIALVAESLAYADSEAENLGKTLKERITEALGKVSNKMTETVKASLDISKAKIAMDAYNDALDRTLTLYSKLEGVSIGSVIQAQVGAIEQSKAQLQGKARFATKSSDFLRKRVNEGLKGANLDTLPDASTVNDVVEMLDKIGNKGDIESYDQLAGLLNQLANSLNNVSEADAELKFLDSDRIAAAGKIIGSITSKFKDSKLSLEGMNAEVNQVLTSFTGLGKHAQIFKNEVEKVRNAAELSNVAYRESLKVTRSSVLALHDQLTIQDGINNLVTGGYTRQEAAAQIRINQLHDQLGMVNELNTNTEETKNLEQEIALLKEKQSSLIETDLANLIRSNELKAQEADILIRSGNLTDAARATTLTVLRESKKFQDAEPITKAKLVAELKNQFKWEDKITRTKKQFDFRKQLTAAKQDLLITAASSKVAKRRLAIEKQISLARLESNDLDALRELEDFLNTKQKLEIEIDLQTDLDEIRSNFRVLGFEIADALKEALDTGDNRDLFATMFKEGKDSGDEFSQTIGGLGVIITDTFKKLETSVREYDDISDTFYDRPKTAGENFQVMAKAGSDAFSLIAATAEEGSAAQKVATLAAQGLALANAVAAVMHQGTSGDAYTAFARMAAMAATAAAFLGQIGQTLSGGGGSAEAAQAQIDAITSKDFDSDSSTNAIQNSFKDLIDVETSLLTTFSETQKEIAKLNRNLSILGASLSGQFGSFNKQDITSTTGISFGSQSKPGFLGGLFGASSTQTDLVSAGVNITLKMGETLASGVAEGTADSEFNKQISQASDLLIGSVIEGIGFVVTKTVKTKSGFLGFGGGTKTSINTYFSGLSEAVLTGLKTTLDDTVNTVYALFAAIGPNSQFTTLAESLSTEWGNTILTNIARGIASSPSLDKTTQFNLTGKGAEEQTAIISAFFSNVTNEIIATAAPWLQTLQHAGEQLTDTLARIVKQVVLLREAFTFLGVRLTEANTTFGPQSLSQWGRDFELFNVGVFTTLDQSADAGAEATEQALIDYYNSTVSSGTLLGQVLSRGSFGSEANTEGTIARLTRFVGVTEDLFTATSNSLETFVREIYDGYGDPFDPSSYRNESVTRVKIGSRPAIREAIETIINEGFAGALDYLVASSAGSVTALAGIYSVNHATLVKDINQLAGSSVWDALIGQINYFVNRIVELSDTIFGYRVGGQLDAEALAIEQAKFSNALSAVFGGSEDKLAEALSGFGSLIRTESESAILALFVSGEQMGLAFTSLLQTAESLFPGLYFPEDTVKLPPVLDASVSGIKNLIEAFEFGAISTETFSTGIEGFIKSVLGADSELGSLSAEDQGTLFGLLAQLGSIASDTIALSKLAIKAENDRHRQLTAFLELENSLYAALGIDKEVSNVSSEFIDSFNEISDLFLGLGPSFDLATNGIDILSTALEDGSLTWDRLTEVLGSETTGAGQLAIGSVELLIETLTILSDEAGTVAEELREIPIDEIVKAVRGFGIIDTRNTASVQQRFADILFAAYDDDLGKLQSAMEGLAGIFSVQGAEALDVLEGFAFDAMNSFEKFKNSFQNVALDGGSIYNVTSTSPFADIADDFIHLNSISWLFRRGMIGTQQYMDSIEYSIGNILESGSSFYDLSVEENAVLFGLLADFGDMANNAIQQSKAMVAAENERHRLAISRIEIENSILESLGLTSKTAISSTFITDFNDLINNGSSALTSWLVFGSEFDLMTNGVERLTAAFEGNPEMFNDLIRILGSELYGAGLTSIGSIEILVETLDSLTEGVEDASSNIEDLFTTDSVSELLNSAITSSLNPEDAGRAFGQALKTTFVDSILQNMISSFSSSIAAVTTNLITASGISGSITVISASQFAAAISEVTEQLVTSLAVTAEVLSNPLVIDAFSSLFDTFGELAEPLADLFMSTEDSTWAVNRNTELLERQNSAYEGLVSYLEGFTSSQFSAISPLEKLREEEAEFFDLISTAISSDNAAERIAALEAVPQAADELLTIGESFFGGFGQGWTTLVDSVLDSIKFVSEVTGIDLSDGTVTGGLYTDSVATAPTDGAVDPVLVAIQGNDEAIAIYIAIKEATQDTATSLGLLQEQQFTSSAEQISILRDIYEIQTGQIVSTTQGTA